MGVYDSQIALALRLIAAKGATATWQKHVEITPDPEQPWKTQPAPTLQDQPPPVSGPSYQVKMVLLEPKQDIRYPLWHLMQGTEIPAGAPFALMAQVPFEPQTNDIVVVGTKNYVVKSIDVVAPNDVEKILYKIQLAA